MRSARRHAKPTVGRAGSFVICLGRGSASAVPVQRSILFVSAVLALWSSDARKGHFVGRWQQKPRSCVRGRRLRVADEGPSPAPSGPLSQQAASSYHSLFVYVSMSLPARCVHLRHRSTTTSEWQTDHSSTCHLYEPASRRQKACQAGARGRRY